MHPVLPKPPAEAQSMVAAQDVSSAGGEESSITIERDQNGNATLIDQALFHRLAPAERILTFAARLETATGTEIDHLRELIGTDPALQKLHAVRWAQEDPQNMFHVLETESALTDSSSFQRVSPIGNILLHNWIAKNSEDLISFLTSQRDRTLARGFDDDRGWQYMARMTLMGTDPSRSMELARRWRIPAGEVQGEVMSLWLNHDIEEAAKAIADLYQPGHGGLQNMVGIGEEWAKTDLHAALAFGQDLRYELQDQLATGVIKQWVQGDLAAAVEFVSMQSDPFLKSTLAYPLLEYWANHDPPAALAWTMQNLKGTLQQEKLVPLFRSAAKSDPELARSLVLELDSGEAVDTAISAVLNGWREKERLEQPKRRAIAAREAQQWVLSLPDAMTRRFGVKALNNYFWEDNPDALVSFLTSPQGYLADKEMVETAANSLALEQPHEAMNWALALPPHQAIFARSEVLNQWMHTQPGASFSWLVSPATQSTHPWASRTALRHLARQPASHIQDWFNQLPAAQSDHARRYFRAAAKKEPQQLEVLQNALGRS
ncbi:MAG: hypothetical protein AAGD22_06700 [Verrucomicrobiota bacterium]